MLSLPLLPYIERQQNTDHDPDERRETASATKTRFAQPGAVAPTAALHFNFSAMICRRARYRARFSVTPCTWAQQHLPTVNHAEPG